MHSFPRSAWECSPGRSASLAAVEAIPRSVWDQPKYEKHIFHTRITNGKFIIFHSKKTVI